MTKLKPCPFCGGEAKLERGTTQLDNFVYCSDCGSGTRFFNTKQSAIEAWNRREPTDKIVEQLEQIQNFEERTGRGYCPDGDECRYKYSDLGCTHCAFEKAIEIVKKGGAT